MLKLLPQNKIYLLPNAITTVAFFCGFYAILASQAGEFRDAGIAIFVAMVLDGLDGRIARLTNTQSEFGSEYDSLSDLIAFGIAPGMMAYHWSLSNWNEYALGWAKFGWLIAFLYVASTAIRLARFNTSSGAQKKYFLGLPSPTGAAVLTGFVWTGYDLNLEGDYLTFLTVLITLLVSFLMTSSVLYPSFKDIDFKKRMPVFWLLVLVLCIALMAYDPPKMLLLISLTYTTIGLFVGIWRLNKRKKRLKFLAEQRKKLKLNH